MPAARLCASRPRAFEPIRAMSVLVRREERPEGGYLVHVTIDNARKLNSLNRALMTEIVETAGRLAEDSQLRLAIRTRAGQRAFVGPADIGEIAAPHHANPPRLITTLQRRRDAIRCLPAP